MITVRMINRILIIRKSIAINMMRRKPSIFNNPSSESVESVNAHISVEKELNEYFCLRIGYVCDPMNCLLDVVAR